MKRILTKTGEVLFCSLLLGIEIVGGYRCLQNIVDILDGNN